MNGPVNVMVKLYPNQATNIVEGFSEEVNQESENFEEENINIGKVNIVTD